MLYLLSIELTAGVELGCCLKAEILPKCWRGASMVYLGLMIGSVSYMDMDVSVGVVYRVKCSVTIGVVV